MDTPATGTPSVAARFVAAAYNLVRISKLFPAQATAGPIGHAVRQLLHPIGGGENPRSKRLDATRS